MPSPNSPEESPYRTPTADRDAGPPSNWSKAGFFVGIGLFFLSLWLAFYIGPWAFAVGLIAAVLFGVFNRKFGFVSGFLAGLLICVGLAFLALIVICGGHGVG